MAALGFAMMLIGVVLIGYSVYFRIAGEKAVGKVVGYISKKKKSLSGKSNQKETEMFTPVVEFSVDKRYRFKSNFSQNRKPFDEGELVDVFYMKGDPLNAKIKSNGTVSFGFVMLLLGMPFVYLEFIWWGLNWISFAIFISITIVGAIKAYVNMKEKWRKDNVHSIKQAIEFAKSKAKAKRDKLYQQEKNGVIGFQFEEELFDIE